MSSVDATIDQGTAIRDLITILGLSFHAVFEGLAVGLEEEESEVWQLFGAVAAHKFVISFCFGMELVNGRTPALLHTIYITVFALVSPLGIGIGLAVSEGATEERGYELSTAVLQVIN